MSLQPGARLGHYEIERVLGAGGMGIVYSAFDSRLQRPVAIKLIQPAEGQDPIARLLTEARSASALNHPNVCTIHDVAEYGDRAFIVMERIEGRPLNDVIAEGALEPSAALDIALQVAGALAHAHERGIVHGDLKSANVLLSSAGRAKVVDFGLARLHQPGEPATHTSVARGTPYAMAPEQLRGARPDTRSDVWSFGVLLQELLAGTRPFERTTVAELWGAILHEAPAPVPPHVVPSLRRIIERCLARDAARRYQRAGEVLAALEASSDARRRVSRAVEAPAGPGEIPPPPALAAGVASQIPLIGREEDLRALGAAWQRARAGRRQLALVAGEPGIGKTRLVTEFTRAVAREATVLFGRCDQEALVPYQPFVEALDWYVRECPPDVLEAQLAEVDGRLELAQLIPVLARRVAIVSEPVESNPEGRRYRLFEAVATLASAIASARPLLIVLEDLHWADRPTLLLLRHLLRSSHEGPFCLVATYRDTELARTHPLAEVLADLRREEGVARVAVRGLDEEHVRQFIGGWIGRESPASLTRVVAENTEGNPFFIGEVLRHLGETGALGRLAAEHGKDAGEELGLPEGVREAIGRRLARLSDACNRVLGLAAIVGREFTLPVLHALAELPEDRLLDVIDEAVAARLVQDVPGAPGRYTFTHALVRETLYGELTAARRARLHRQVAETLERLASPGDPPLADLAHHYAHAASAADAGKAVEYAVRAAERAAASFALEEAVRFYHLALQALDLLPEEPALRARRFDLRFRRGRAFANVGQWAPARRELETALELLDPRESGARAELLLELAKCAFWLLDVPAVRRFAGEALSIADSLGRDDLAADAIGWMGGALNSDGDVAGAIELNEGAIVRAGGIRSFALAFLPISLYLGSRLQEAVDRAAQAVEGSRSVQDPSFRIYALEHLGISLAGVGRYAEARRAFDETRDFGKRYGVLPMLARGIAMSAAPHMALGNYPRAEAIAHEARELARLVSFPPPFVSAGIDLLLIFARTGEPGRAEPIFDEVARAATGASGWHGWLWRLRLSQAKAELALARGDWQATIAAATEGIADSHARTRRKYEALGFMTRARARKALDDVPAAIDDASRAVDIARALGDPAVLLAALALLIDLDGSDVLVAEARGCLQRMLVQIDDVELRQRFMAGQTGLVQPAPN